MRGPLRRILTAAAAATLVAVVAAACEPYIHDPQEFNRDSPTFARELTDRDEVPICYNTRATTPQDILAMAEAECSRVGKVARYRYTEILECPLATPARAMFACDPQ